MTVHAEAEVLVSVTNYSLYCAAAKELLTSAGVRLIENPHGRPFTAAELVAHVSSVDAVIAGVDNWDRGIFEHAPRLRHIARFGTGVDNINLDDAKECGIIVTNARGGNANAVAEQTIGFIIGALRGFAELDASVRGGRWPRFVGRELRGKRLGLLGFGQIPQIVARKLRDWDIEILAFDKYPDADAAERLGVGLVSFEDVMSASDIISVHLPSVKETYHAINADSLSLTQEGVYLINTSRGSLVDELAVAEYLENGRLRGAALDVYETEPVTDAYSLRRFPQVLLTPHTAGDTYETYRENGMTTAKAVIDVLLGKEPQNIVPG